MRGSALLPKQFRSLGNTDGWLYRSVTAQLLTVAHVVCQHPIHTIVVIALLASTSYVGLLQESLFSAAAATSGRHGQLDLDYLLIGSRTVELSKNTNWKWQLQSEQASGQVPPDVQHLALTTLTFPDSSSSQYVPDNSWVSLPENVTATQVPSTLNLLSSISQDSVLAFYMPYSQAADFLQAVQEVESPSQSDRAKWTMRASRNGESSRARSYAIWLREGWSSFGDLIKVCIPHA